MKSARSITLIAQGDTNIQYQNKGRALELYKFCPKDYNGRISITNCKGDRMCYPMGRTEEVMWYFGIKVFLLVWIVFVPIAITSRLEKIIKLLEEKNKNN